MSEIGPPKDWSGNPFTAEQAVLFIEEGQVIRTVSFFEFEEGVHAVEDRLVGSSVEPLLHLSLLAAYQVAESVPEVRVKLLTCLAVMHEGVPIQKNSVASDDDTLPF